MTLTHLSWIIGLANPASALLVGPCLAWLLRARPPAVRRRAQIVGWCLLAVAQLAFLAFGFAGGYAGFQFAQPMMIPISAANFAVAWFLTRPDGTVVDAEGHIQPRRR